MYQLGTTQAGTVLATTGAMATGYYLVGAWTRLVAGMALVMTAPVLHRRRAAQR